jgi:hypothetical protein
MTVFSETVRKMNEKCIDLKIGTLLHGYELDLLNEAEREQFEKHLLSCDFCLHELKNGSHVSKALLENQDLIAQLTEGRSGHDDQPTDVSWGKRTGKSGTRLLIRVAAVVALLLLPFGYYLISVQHGTPKPTETVLLLPDRSEGSVYTVSKNSNIEFQFVFEDSDPNREYVVTFVDSNGKIVHKDEHFTAFDKNSLGKMTLPSSLFIPGPYRLSITDPSAPSEAGSREYRFNIVYK